MSTIKCLLCKKTITKNHLHISHERKNKKQDFCSMKCYAEYLGVKFVIIDRTEHECDEVKASEDIVPELITHRIRLSDTDTYEEYARYVELSIEDIQKIISYAKKEHMVLQL